MTLDSFFVFRELAMIGKVVTNTLYMGRNESTVVTRVVVTLTGIAFCPFVAVITIQLCLTFLSILNVFPNLARETFTMKKSIQNIASFVGKTWLSSWLSWIWLLLEGDHFANYSKLNKLNRTLSWIDRRVSFCSNHRSKFKITTILSVSHNTHVSI